MAIELKVPVPTEYIDKTIEMLKLFSGKSIAVRVGSARERMVRNFVLEEQGENEGDLAFANRLLKEFMLNNLRIVARHKKDNAKTIAMNEAVEDIVEEVIPEDSIG